MDERLIKTTRWPYIVDWTATRNGTDWSIMECDAQGRHVCDVPNQRDAQLIASAPKLFRACVVALNDHPNVAMQRLHEAIVDAVGGHKCTHGDYHHKAHGVWWCPDCGAVATGAFGKQDPAEWKWELPKGEKE